MSTTDTVPSGGAERERVLGILRRQRPLLHARGVRRLALFGSVARGEAEPFSDVDLLAEIDHTRSGSRCSISSAWRTTSRKPSAVRSRS